MEYPILDSDFQSFCALRGIFTAQDLWAFTTSSLLLRMQSNNPLQSRAENALPASELMSLKVEVKDDQEQRGLLSLSKSKDVEQFKPFDMVTDWSDQHFLDGADKGVASSQVQQEWSILEKNLPETIYVRVYEERIDLLQAAIVGPPGTPYHDRLFFFDIFLPPEVPNEPPHFEALVEEHFGNRSDSILYACKEYMKGAPVGFAFGGGEQAQETQKGSSAGFKIMLAKLFNKLVDAFTEKGIDCSQLLGAWILNLYGIVIMKHRTPRV